MHWLRPNTGRIAWLALFALACQLVFSFGHVHLGKNVGNVWTAVFGAASTTNQPGLPSPQGPVGTTDDFCAICANINLVGTLVRPILASILAPVAVTIELPRPQAGVRPRSIAHLLFSARGPPQT
jgi:hypothetical protein